MHLTGHISDIHLHDQRSVDRARATLSYLGDLSTRPEGPDVVVITGDIADDGKAEQYDVARDLIATVPVPVLLCPGNHDDRAAYRRGLDGPSGVSSSNRDGPVHADHRVGEIRYLLVDSTIPGADEGLLSEATLAWLDSALAKEPDTPTYVAFHHPPVALGASYPDGLRLTNPEPLADVVERHRQVSAILCGHAHTAAVTTFAGRPLLVASGVLSTANLDAERGVRGEAAVDFDAPPLVSFHLRHDDGRITTHVRVAPPETRSRP